MITRRVWANWTVRRKPRRLRLALLPGLLGLLALSAWPAAAAAQTLVPEITYFRIGTGPSSGTYFPVGGLIATGTVSYTHLTLPTIYSV